MRAGLRTLFYRTQSQTRDPSQAQDDTGFGAAARRSLVANQRPSARPFAPRMKNIRSSEKATSFPPDINLTKAIADLSRSQAARLLDPESCC